MEVYVQLNNDSDVNRLPGAQPFLLTMLPLLIVYSNFFDNLKDLAELKPSLQWDFLFNL